MTKLFSRTALLFLLILSILSAVSLAEEIAAPTEEMAAQNHSDDAASGETAQPAVFVPSVSVLYQDHSGGDSTVVLADQPSFDARNGGVFTVVASCITPENVEYSIAQEKNAQGMALLGFTLRKVEDEGFVTVLETVDFPDPTYGTIPLYGLEPGEYMLYVEGVGAADHQNVEGSAVIAVSGWQGYRFKIAE